METDSATALQATIGALSLMQAAKGCQWSSMNRGLMSALFDMQLHSGSFVGLTEQARRPVRR